MERQMMGDTRRFLRYVLPGMAAGIEFVLLISLSGLPWWTWESLKSPSGFSLTILVLAFLASAALGYVFSIFHHVLLWNLYIPLRLCIDYRPLIKHAEEENWLELRVIGEPNNGDAPPAYRLTVEGAWRLLTALWHERIDTSGPVKSANQRADSLADIVHGTGAAFVGSIAAVMGWFFATFVYSWCYLCPSLGDLFPSIVVAVSIISGHFLGLVITIRHSRSFVQIVLGDALRADSSEGYWPVQCMVTKHDVHQTSNRLLRGLLNL